MLTYPVCFRCDTRSADYQQADRFGFTSDDGIGVQGRTQIERTDLFRVLTGEYRTQHLADRFEQIIVQCRSLGSGDDLVDNQIGFARGRRADMDGFVGLAPIGSFPDGATASAPTEPVGWPSKIGSHVRPKSSVFQTPPSLAAM